MPRPGKGKPNYKNRNQGEDYNKDRTLPDYKAAWVETKFMQAGVLIGPEQEGIEDEDRDVVLVFYTPGKFPNLYFSLGNFTGDELEAVSKLINTALDWARPVAKRRDMEAEVALENGDDTVDRLYRPVPQLVFRQRKVGEHYEGVQLRSAGVSSSGRRIFVGDPDGSVRGAGDGLAEHDSGESRSQDDTAETHEPEAVRDLGGSVEPPERVHGSQGIQDDSASDS